MRITSRQLSYMTNYLHHLINHKLYTRHSQFDKKLQIQWRNYVFRTLFTLYVMYNVNICRANIFIKYAANIKWVRPRANKPLPLLKQKILTIKNKQTQLIKKSILYWYEWSLIFALWSGNVGCLQNNFFPLRNMYQACSCHGIHL